MTDMKNKSDCVVLQYEHPSVHPSSGHPPKAGTDLSKPLPSKLEGKTHKGGTIPLPPPQKKKNKNNQPLEPEWCRIIAKPQTAPGLSDLYYSPLPHNINLIINFFRTVGRGELVFHC